MCACCVQRFRVCHSLVVKAYEDYFELSHTTLRVNYLKSFNGAVHYYHMMVFGEITLVTSGMWCS